MFFPEVCVPPLAGGEPTGTNFPVSQTYYHQMKHMMSHFSICCFLPNCQVSLLSNELTNFSSLALSLSLWYRQLTGQHNGADKQCVCSDI